MSARLTSCAAAAAAALAAATLPTLAEAPGGTVKLKRGEARWMLTSSDSRRLLALDAPATVIWKGSKIEQPVRIGARSDALALFDRWEIALWRSTDRARRHPVARWSGPARTLPDGVTWDGRTSHGPSIRPGETLLATLRVRDAAGRIDEAGPQEILVTRHLMPKASRAAAREDERRAALDVGPETVGIPFEGARLTLRAPKGLAVDGVRMQEGTITLALPPGSFDLAIQSPRPLLRGGERLVREGRVSLTVPARSPERVPVRGAGAMVRGDDGPRLDGLRPTGSVAGRDAVRLKPLKDASGLAWIDPQLPVPLHEDPRGWLVAAVSPPERRAPWATAPAKPATPVETRVRFTAMRPVRLVLPHTDVEPGEFRLALRFGDGAVVTLRRHAEFAVEPRQGLVLLTEAGRERLAAAYEEAGGSEGVIEAIYRVRPSLAGLSRDAGGTRTVEGDGSALLGTGPEVAAR